MRDVRDNYGSLTVDFGSQTSSIRCTAVTCSTRCHEHHDQRGGPQRGRPPTSEPAEVSPDEVMDCLADDGDGVSPDSSEEFPMRVTLVGFAVVDLGSFGR